MNANPITTHILDTGKGCPAKGVPIKLEISTTKEKPWNWVVVGEGVTNDDGRISGVLLNDPASFKGGIYRITFDTATYFASIGGRTFYPTVEVFFEILNLKSRYVGFQDLNL